MLSNTLKLLMKVLSFRLYLLFEAADINLDGEVKYFDVAGFIELFMLD